MQIEISSEWESFLKTRIAEGRFRTAEEAVEEGLRLMQEDEKAQETAFKDLKASLEEAAGQLDRGEYIEVTPANVGEFVADLKRQGREDFENRELSA